MQPNGSGADYAVRWDPVRRRLDGPLTPAEAERRHGALEPFAAVLTLAGRLPVVLESGGHDGGLTAWCLDERGRRVASYEFRIDAAERMELLRVVQTPIPEGCVEFDPAGPRCATTLDGTGQRQEEITGPEWYPWRTLDWHRGEHKWHDVPAFGEWDGLLRFVLDVPPPIPEVQEVEIGPYPLRPLPGFTGHGIGPGQEVVEMFEAPRRYDFANSLRLGVVTVETRPAGVLVLPTGRLMAVNPEEIPAKVRAFAAAVPPGRYPVTIAGFVADSGFAVTGCRIEVRDEQATVWEEALLEGEEPSGQGELHSFEPWRLAFVDAAVLPGFLDTGARHLRWDVEDALAEDELGAEYADPRSGANVISVRCGNDCAAWVGRNGDGDVVCIVIDSLMLVGVLPAQGASGGS